MRISFFLIPFFVLLMYACGDRSSNNPDNRNDKTNVKYRDSLVQKFSARIDSFFTNRSSRELFNGTVLFAEKGIIVYANAFGIKNRRTKDSLELGSKFQLASATKPFTAYAVMLLKERNKLSYSDSIRHFFPNFSYENITIHQLLTHRSGLPEYFYFADKYWKDENNITINNNDVIDLLIEYEPMRYYLPGQRYDYCNTNYAILAAIIEKVSGEPYSQFMKEEIFLPLGMSDTEVYDKEENPGNGHEVVGYMGRRIADNTYLNGVVGDKGIYSTVIDMFKFDRALYAGTLVSKKELDSVAYQLGNPELYDNDNYGYGWRVNKRKDGTKLVHHAGWWKGFRSYFIRELKTEKVIIVLTNQSRNGSFGLQDLSGLFDIKTE